MTATGLIMRRQIRAALADPGPSFVLPMLPPLLMVVVFTSVFDPMAQVDGYDTSGYTSGGWDAHLVPGVVVLVALLGAGYTSSSLAADLRSGYAARLRLAGVRTWSHLAGRLAFEAVRLVPGVAVVLGAGLLLGGAADNGLAGLAIVVVLVALLGVAFTGVFHIVAARTADPQTPFTLQPLGLPLAFLSSALVPLAVMPGWSRAVARINPVSVVVDAARNAMIGDPWSVELAAAALVLVLWTGLSQLGAYLALRAVLSGG